MTPKLTPEIIFLVEVEKKDLDSIPENVRKFEPIKINRRISTTKGPTIFGKKHGFSFILPPLNEQDRMDAASAIFNTFKGCPVNLHLSCADGEDLEEIPVSIDEIKTRLEEFVTDTDNRPSGK